MRDARYTAERSDALPESLVGVILAGGLGTRLRGVLPDRQKTVANVGGRPFLAWWLDELEQLGLRKVVLCTGHLAGQVNSILGDSHRQLRIFYSTEAQPLGTGGALVHALPLLSSDPLLVLNGDSFCEIDFPGFWRAHLACRARASLVLAQVSNASRYGAVLVAPGGRVLDFQEKPAATGAGGVNAGIYLLSRDMLVGLPADTFLSLERDLMPRWIGHGVHSYPASGQLIDIGTPESYVEADRFFSGNARHGAWVRN